MEKMTIGTHEGPMVASKDNIQTDRPGESTRTVSPPRLTVDTSLLALARLLGRQAAREAFRAARNVATEASEPGSPSPATRADEE